MSHLILYDALCPLCNKAVQNVIARDKKRKFLFSSLQGKTAGSLCNMLHVSDEESMILIENYQTQKQRIYYRAKAVFRTFWLLGGIYKAVGWKYILPSWSIDWVYSMIAKRRYKICKVTHLDNEPFRKGARFLP